MTTELEQLFDCLKTGQLDGKVISGYWIDQGERWLCPECFNDFLMTIAPCIDEKEFELFSNECDSCGNPLIDIIDE